MDRSLFSVIRQVLSYEHYSHTSMGKEASTPALTPFIISTFQSSFFLAPIISRNPLEYFAAQATPERVIAKDNININLLTIPSVLVLLLKKNPQNSKTGFPTVNTWSLQGEILQLFW